MTTLLDGANYILSPCRVGAPSPWLLFGAIFTIAYVYPINAVLFEQAGGGQSGDEIRALVNEWIFRESPAG